MEGEDERDDDVRSDEKEEENLFSTTEIFYKQRRPWRATHSPNDNEYRKGDSLPPSPTQPDTIRM